MAATETEVYEERYKFAAENKIKDLEKIIEEENLKEQETKRFIENAFKDG